MLVPGLPDEEMKQLPPFSHDGPDRSPGFLMNVLFRQRRICAERKAEIISGPVVLTTITRQKIEQRSFVYSKKRGRLLGLPAKADEWTECPSELGVG